MGGSPPVDAESANCCSAFRAEFQAAPALTIWGGTESNAQWADVFASSPWVPTSRTGFLVWRLALLAVFVPHFVADLQYFWWDGFYLMQFTGWTLVAQSIYFLMAAFTTWRAQRVTPPTGKVALPWHARLTLALMHLCVPASVLVAVGYWSTLSTHEFSPVIVYTTVFSHGLNAFMALLDLLVSGSTFSLRYSVFLVLFAFSFVVWSLIHHVSGLGNPHGCRQYPMSSCPIYPILDWHEPALTAVYCLVTVFILPVPLSLPVWLLSRRCHPARRASLSFTTPADV